MYSKLIVFFVFYFTFSSGENTLKLRSQSCNEQVMNQLQEQNLNPVCNESYQIIVDCENTNISDVSLSLLNQTLEDSIIFLNGDSVQFNKIEVNNSFSSSGVLLSIQQIGLLQIAEFNLTFNTVANEEVSKTEIIVFQGVVSIIVGILSIDIEQKVDDTNNQIGMNFLCDNLQRIAVQKLLIKETNPQDFQLSFKSRNLIITEIFFYYSQISSDYLQYLNLSAQSMIIGDINIDFNSQAKIFDQQISFSDFTNLSITSININSFISKAFTIFSIFIPDNLQSDYSVNIDNIFVNKFNQTLAQIDRTSMIYVGGGQQDNSKNQFQLPFVKDQNLSQMVQINSIIANNLLVCNTGIISFSNVKNVLINDIKINPERKPSKVYSTLLLFSSNIPKTSVIINSLSIENIEYNFSDGGIICAYNLNLFQLNKSFFNVTKTISTSFGGFLSLTLIQDAQILNTIISLQNYAYLKVQFGGFIYLGKVTNARIENLIFESPSLDSQVSQVQQGGIIFSEASSESIIIKNVEATNLHISGDGGFAYIQNAQISISQFNIMNFKSNKNGGAFFFDQNQIVDITEKGIELDNVTIISCSSQFTGGAFFGGNIISANQVKIQDCNSLFGGGFYSTNFENKSDSRINFSGNSALYYGDNISKVISSVNCLNVYEHNPDLGEYLRKVNVSFTQSITNQKVYIKEMINGLQYAIEIAFVIDGEIIQINSDSESQNNLSEQVFGSIIGFKSIEFENLPFQGNQNITSNSLYFIINLQQSFTDDSYFLNFQFINTTNSNNQMELILSTNITSECKVGMQRSSYRSSYFCSYCEGSVSYIENPSTKTKCQPCSTEMFSECYGNYSIVKTGYWRETIEVSSDYVYPCSESSSCIGGFLSGNDICETGHIGVECAECDLYNQRGDGSYFITNQYSCQKCSNIKYNILKIVGLLLLIFIAILIIFANNFRQQRNFIYKKYLSEMKIIYLGKSYYRLGQGSSFMRVLSFFFQIITISTYYQSRYQWKRLFGFYQQFLNPVSNSEFSFDCFLAQQFPNNTSITNQKIMIVSISPFIISIISILPSLIQLLRSKITTKQFYYSVLLVSSYGFTTLFYIPVVDILIQGILCQTFNNGQSYSIIDFNIECSDPSRVAFLIIFIIPFLIIYSIGIPGIFLYILLKNKNNLDKISCRFLLGYLYVDYKEKFFYWEFVRLFVKLILTIAVYSFISETQLMGFISLFILIIYLILLQQKKPYVSKKLNDMEQKSVIIGSLMLIAYMINYVEEEKALQQQNFNSNGFYSLFSSIILVCINLLSLIYIIYMISQIWGSLIQPHLYKLLKYRIYQFIVHYFKILKYKEYTPKKRKNLVRLRTLAKKISKDSMIDYSHYPLIISSNGTINNKELDSI